MGRDAGDGEGVPSRSRTRLLCRTQKPEGLPPHAWWLDQNCVTRRRCAQAPVARPLTDASPQCSGHFPFLAPIRERWRRPDPSATGGGAACSTAFGLSSKPRWTTLRRRRRSTAPPATGALARTGRLHTASGDHPPCTCPTFPPRTPP